MFFFFFFFAMEFSHVFSSLVGFLGFFLHVFPFEMLVSHCQIMAHLGPARLLSTSTNELRIWDVSAILTAEPDLEQEVNVPCLICGLAETLLVNSWGHEELKSFGETRFLIVFWTVTSSGQGFLL